MLEKNELKTTLIQFYDKFKKSLILNDELTKEQEQLLMDITIKTGLLIASIKNTNSEPESKSEGG